MGAPMFSKFVIFYRKVFKLQRDTSFKSRKPNIRSVIENKTLKIPELFSHKTRLYFMIHTISHYFFF